MLTSLVLLFILVGLYFCINKNNLNNSETQPNKDTFVNTDNLYFKQDPYIVNEFADPPCTRKTKTMKFNYGIRHVDKVFLNEQENGVNLNTWYPNTYIEKLDKDGKPIWGSREKTTCTKNTMVQEKVRKTYEFNQPKSIHMDGPIHASAECTKIADVYDNYFVDYKKLTPHKTLVVEELDCKKDSGASNLKFFSPETWIYENEKPENGGMIAKGLYGADMNNLNPIATY